jgi:hypothetical protein
VRKTKLLSTVGLALLLGAGAASAQGMGKEPPERAPAAQQSAPAEKVAPSIKAGEQKSPQTAGQAAPDGKATGKGHETTGQSPKAEAPDKAGAMDKDKSGAPSGKSDIRSKPEQNGAASKSTQSTTEQNRSTTTGQGAAAGSAKLSPVQRTKITSIIREHKVEPTKLSVSVSIGTRVPASVHLYPLPVQVVEVYPAWRGFEYILVGDQIVVINPRTHEIVAIIEA